MNAPLSLQQESLYIDVNANDKLHLRRLFTNPEGTPVFMVHGSIENGKIFYTKSGKGLAAFLAKAGYDVFVADFRGRGDSTPPIGPGAEHGKREFLWEDFPAFLNRIVELKGPVPQIWVAHSWGGVDILTFLARKNPPAPVKSLVFFGSKRRITQKGLKKWFMIDLMWWKVARSSVKKRGFLDGRKVLKGSDNETGPGHYETHMWVLSSDWKDWYDDFDYAAALKKMNLPPILSLTGSKDDILGHPEDARALLKEAGADSATFKVIGKSTGHTHDYDHINLLTHPDAQKDHFPRVLNWLEGGEF